MGSLVLLQDCTTPPAQEMAWTWTGYDLDAVHRFKDDNFFQTGRNLAEDRFWKTQIHGSDRRGTKSSISLGDRDRDTESPASNDYKLYQYKDCYSYSEPRERSNSVVSTFSTRMKQFGPSKDYPYSYPGEIIEQEEDQQEEQAKNSQESKDDSEQEETKVEEKEEGAKENEEESKEEAAAKEDSSCNHCSCSDTKEASPSPVKEEKQEIKEKTAEDDKNVKS